MKAPSFKFLDPSKVKCSEKFYKSDKLKTISYLFLVVIR